MSRQQYALPVASMPMHLSCFAHKKAVRWGSSRVHSPERGNLVVVAEQSRTKDTREATQLVAQRPLFATAEPLQAKTSSPVEIAKKVVVRQQQLLPRKAEMKKADPETSLNLLHPCLRLNATTALRKRPRQTTELLSRNQQRHRRPPVRRSPARRGDAQRVCPEADAPGSAWRSERRRGRQDAHAQTSRCHPKSPSIDQ